MAWLNSNHSPTLQNIAREFPLVKRFHRCDWQCQEVLANRGCRSKIRCPPSEASDQGFDRITGEHVDMLRDLLEKESGDLAIDLKNVVLVDREAVKLLALSDARGTELRNCPPYIREWVTRERAETHGPPSEQEIKGNEDIEDE